MFIKGENCSNDTQPSDKKSTVVFTSWNDEDVWSVDLNKYIKGSEYDEKFGHPDRTYIYNEQIGKNILMCEHRKIVPYKGKGFGIKVMQYGVKGTTVETYRKDGTMTSETFGREVWI